MKYKDSFSELRMIIQYHRNLLPLFLRISSFRTSRIVLTRYSFTVVSVPEEFESRICHANDNKSLKDADSEFDSFIDKLIQESISAKDSKTMALCTENLLSKLKFDDFYASLMKTKAEKSVVSQLRIMERYVQNCKEKNLFPEQETCLVLLHIFAKNGNKESILILKEMSSKYNRDGYIKEGCYDHFLGEALWRSGNIEHAIDLFWKVFETNVPLRRKIKNMLRVLMRESIYSKGEAVLILLIKFSEKLMKYNNDYSLLSYVWEICFLSAWHSDNQIASSLLEKYPELKKYLSLQVYELSSTSLAVHKLDVVHRLFEELLKYDMKKEYEIVLRSLFDYACSKRDKTACSAIIESTNQMEVSLTEDQHKNFLMLFQNDVPVSSQITQPPKFLFIF